MAFYSDGSIHEKGLQFAGLRLVPRLAEANGI